MNKKENHLVLQTLGLIVIIMGLLDIIIHHDYSGPIFIAFGIIMTTIATFKNKKHNNRMFYNTIILVPLAGMLIGEYFLVHIQNTIVYVLLLITAIGIFIFAYFSFIPQNPPSKREEALSLTGVALFIMSFSMMGPYDFVISLIVGVFSLIMLAIIWLIRRKYLKIMHLNEV